VKHVPIRQLDNCPIQQLDSQSPTSSSASGLVVNRSFYFLDLRTYWQFHVFRPRSQISSTKRVSPILNASRRSYYFCGLYATAHYSRRRKPKRNRTPYRKRSHHTVATVEHALSALAGHQIDNCLVTLTGPEVPILDGSAGPFFDAIANEGVEEQAAEREYFEIEQPIEFRDELTGAELVAMPADHFEVTTMIDFNSKVLGPQYATMNDLSDYGEEIAHSRTFVFLHEIEKLLSQDLIKGGSLDNAIVIAEREVSKVELASLAERLGRESVAIDSSGVLNTTKLKFQNEPARHKLLDVIGDLTLIGCPIKGKIVARKPGHAVNTAFAKRLKSELKEQRKLRGVPKYDPTVAPIMDTVQIMGYLPHRYPMLLVDKVIGLSDTHVVGVKNITFNEGVFQGHFPNNPVFPGVLQIEALAQTGGMLAISISGNPGEWDMYFVKMDNVKFRGMVKPGDTLILKMELLSPIRRGIVHMQGTAYVGNTVVSEGELIAQIIKR